MNEHDKDKKLGKLLSALGGFISDTPEDELIEEIRERGETPERDAERFSYIINSSLQKSGLDDKSFARAGYAQLLLKYKNFIKQSLPKSLPEGRESLLSLLGSQEGGATAQFRQFSSLPEADTAGMFSNLQFLSEEVDESDFSKYLTHPTTSAEYSETRDSELTYLPGESSIYYKSPDQLLRHLEITDPGSIDIEAIAFSQGAFVIYEPLQKCEAYVLSKDISKAVIVVNEDAPRSRQRFSVAHELGHWMRDRNSSVFCEKKAYADSWYGDNSEVMANYYAKDLLMPEFLFAPIVKNLTPTLENVRKLADTFRTSLTASSRRFVELSSEPSAVVFRKFSTKDNAEPARTVWFRFGSEVSTELHPHWKMDAGTLSQEIRINDEVHEVAGNVDADAWLVIPKEKNIKIREESIRINCNNILTLLSWEQDVESA